MTQSQKNSRWKRRNHPFVVCHSMKQYCAHAYHIHLFHIGCKVSVAISLHFPIYFISFYTYLAAFHGSKYPFVSFPFFYLTTRHTHINKSLMAFSLFLSLFVIFFLYSFIVLLHSFAYPFFTSRSSLFISFVRGSNQFSCTPEID